MNKYPVYVNRQVIQTLDNDVVLTLSKGILSIHAVNQFGAEEEVYCHPLSVDRPALGPVFAKHGREVESKVLHALQNSMLWKQAGNFSNRVHGRATELLTELTWFLPNATPADVCSVTYRLSLDALSYLTMVGNEMAESRMSRADTLAAVIAENPLNISDNNPAAFRRPNGTELSGIAAIYDMMFDVVVPE